MSIEPGGDTAGVKLVAAGDGGGHRVASEILWLVKAIQTDGAGGRRRLRYIGQSVHQVAPAFVMFRNALTSCVRQNRTLPVRR